MENLFQLITIQETANNSTVTNIVMNNGFTVQTKLEYLAFTYYGKAMNK